MGACARKWFQVVRSSPQLLDATLWKWRWLYPYVWHGLHRYTINLNPYFAVWAVPCLLI